MSLVCVNVCLNLSLQRLAATLEKKVKNNTEKFCFSRSSVPNLGRLPPRRNELIKSTTEKLFFHCSDYTFIRVFNYV